MSYIAANYNTTVYQDPDNAWVASFALQLNGAPMNLTGASIKMVIGPPVNITLSSAGTYSDGLSLGDSSGVVTATLTSAQTCAQSPVAEPHYYFSVTPEGIPGGILFRGTLVWSPP